MTHCIAKTKKRASSASKAIPPMTVSRVLLVEVAAAVADGVDWVLEVGEDAMGLGGLASEVGDGLDSGCGFGDAGVVLSVD